MKKVIITIFLTLNFGLWTNVFAGGGSGGSDTSYCQGTGSTYVYCQSNNQTIATKDISYSSKCCVTIQKAWTKNCSKNNLRIAVKDKYGTNKNSNVSANKICIANTPK